MGINKIRITMVKNMSASDAIIRIVVAVIIAILAYTGVISGTLMYILIGVAVIFTITGFLNFCPLYAVFGIRTRKKTS